MRRKSSLVGRFKRRAASEAISGSVGIGPSVVEAESTAEKLDLSLQRQDAGEVLGVSKGVPSVLECAQQRERLFEIEDDARGRLRFTMRHVDIMATACDINPRTSPARPSRPRRA